MKTASAREFALICGRTAYENFGNIEPENNQQITMTAKRERAHNLLNGEPRQIPETTHTNKVTNQTQKAMMPG